MYLNENEKQLISKEIENLEKKSSAELVAVITKQSSPYKFETLVYTLAISAVIAFISLFFEISAIKLFQIEIISFFILYFIFEKFEKLLLLFIPKTYKYEKASSFASEQFASLGLNKTQTKQAIMFFVSIDEKFVKIQTDINIKSKIDDTYWQKIVDEFILDVKNNNFSLGYIKAIKSCSSILIENFPIKEDDENELQNDVIEL